MDWLTGFFIGYLIGFAISAGIYELGKYLEKKRKKKKIRNLNI